MQWTNFDDSMIPKVVRDARVTLSPRGDFYLNESVVNSLGDPVAVRMLFNKEEGKIGITAAPLHSQGSFRLCTKYGRSAVARKFRALQFCRLLGILPDHTIMFLNPNLENGILVLNTRSTTIAPHRGHPRGPRTY
jgi:hypothetical protein